MSIHWIEAAGNYVRIWVEDLSAPYVARNTMHALQAQLDPSVFVRIHRSLFVNRHKIRALQPWYTGEYIVTLDSGKELMLSRGFRRNLPDLLSVRNRSRNADRAGSAVPDTGEPSSREKANDSDSI